MVRSTSESVPSSIQLVIEDSPVTPRTRKRPGNFETDVAHKKSKRKGSFVRGVVRWFGNMLGIGSGTQSDDDTSGAESEDAPQAHERNSQVSSYSTPSIGRTRPVELGEQSVININGNGGRTSPRLDENSSDLEVIHTRINTRASLASPSRSISNGGVPLSHNSFSNSSRKIRRTSLVRQDDEDIQIIGEGQTSKQKERDDDEVQVLNVVLSPKSSATSPRPMNASTIEQYVIGSETSSSSNSETTFDPLTRRRSTNQIYTPPVGRLSLRGVRNGTYSIPTVRERTTQREAKGKSAAAGLSTSIASIAQSFENGSASDASSLQRFLECAEKFGGVFVEKPTNQGHTQSRTARTERLHFKLKKTDYRSRVLQALGRTTSPLKTSVEVQSDENSSAEGASGSSLVECLSRVASPTLSVTSSTASSRISDRPLDMAERLRQMGVDSKNTMLRMQSYEREREVRKNHLDVLLEEARLRLANRKERQQDDLESLRERLRVTGITVRVPEEKKVDEFPELPKEALLLIERAWNRSLPAQEKMADKFNIEVRRKDLCTLTGMNWLNDEVINFFLNLIMERSTIREDLPKVHAFATFFYLSLKTKGFNGVRRWTKKIDIFSYDILLVPIHLDVHWCMAVIDMTEKRIEYYDSLGSRDPGVLDNLKAYLEAEMQDKKKEKFDSSGWEYFCRKDIPRQENGSDCGMFACRFAEFASRRAELVFTQKHIDYYRQRTVWEICQGRLMNFEDS